MADEKKLWYIADPMCSWCWGFSPVIERLRAQYSGQLNFGLKLGGLRPGTKEPISPSLRQEILHHWLNVQRLTGQPFQFEGALPEGFVYDTEIACRAVISVALIDPEVAFPFFMAIQHAFYAEQLDVTRANVLAKLVVDKDIDQQVFLQLFESKKAKEETFANFQQVHRWGINGFPSIVRQDVNGYQLLVSGYCSAEELFPQLDSWLMS